MPAGGVNSLFATQKGVVIVEDGEKPRVVDNEFTCGEGMLVTDEITWAIWSKHYLTDLNEPYYFQSPKGELLMLVPYVNWKLDFPVTVPEWGGVVVVHGNCQIEKLTSAQALTDERLVGARLVPEEYAKMVASAWQYRLGIINAWFGPHKDQTEFPEIEGEKNQMPYLVPTGDGPAWFIGFEPYGPSYALYKVMYVNAIDGKTSVYNYGKDGVMSPNRVGGFIKGELPNFSWTAKDGSEGVILIEPRPVTVGGILHWMMTQTTNDYAKVNCTFVLRTSDEAILVADSIGEMKRFLNGGTLPRISNQISPCNNNTSPAIDDGAPVSPSADLTQLSEQQLRELMNAIFDELTRR